MVEGTALSEILEQVHRLAMLTRWTRTRLTLVESTAVSIRQQAKSYTDPQDHDHDNINLNALIRPDHVQNANSAPPTVLHSPYQVISPHTLWSFLPNQCS